VPVPPPAEVSGLQVSGASGTTLTWAAVVGSPAYDVASATLSDLRVNGTAGATCLANNVAGPSTVDGRPNPASGDGYYYLVRAQSSCGTGSFGTNSVGAERVPTAGCP